MSGKFGATGLPSSHHGRIFRMLEKATLELPVESLLDAETRLGALVLPAYDARPSRIQSDPRADWIELDGQRSGQTVTMLSLLGYLPRPEDVLAGQYPVAEITRAWSRWRADYVREVQVGGLPAGGITDENRTVIIATETPVIPQNVAGLAEPVADDDGIIFRDALGDDMGLEETDRLRRHLKACASLEGEVNLRKWPTPGEVTLASRIALFRLGLFGVCRESAAEPMPDDMVRHVRSRASWLAATDRLGSSLEVVNVLGDAPKLNGIIIDRLPGWYVVLGPLTGTDQANSPLRMRGISIRDMRARDWQRPIPGRGLLPSGAHYLDPSDPSDAIWNEVAVKFLQVRLWTLGYYPGAIDGSWGPVCEAALRAYLADDDDPPVLDRRPLSDGRSLLRLSPLLKDIAQHADQAVSNLERADLDARLAELPPEETSDDADQVWAGLSRASAAASADGAPGTRAHGVFVAAAPVAENRRPYVGWRGVFHAFGRILRKIVAGVKSFFSVLLDAVKKGAAYVRGVALYLRNATRGAVRLCALGISRARAWLLGTPVLTTDDTACVATRWQRDFDTVYYISPRSSAGLIDLHGRELDWMARSFAVLVRLGLAVLRLALSFGNWPFFAWRALGLARKVVKTLRSDLFKELLAAESPT
jgi:hypothetical protein